MSRESSWCPGKWTKQHLSNKAKTLDSKTLQEWKLRKTWCPNTWYQGWASWALVTSLPLRQGCFTGQQTVRAQDGHKKWMPSECTCIASPKYSLQFVERFADDSMINCFGWKRPTADNSYVKWESSIKALKDITAAAFFSHNRISPHLWPRRKQKESKTHLAMWCVNDESERWCCLRCRFPLYSPEYFRHHVSPFRIPWCYTFIHLPCSKKMSLMMCTVWYYHSNWTSSMLVCNKKTCVSVCFCALNPFDGSVRDGLKELSQNVQSTAWHVVGDLPFSSIF